ncbi:MAG: GNAT family N-acetyltransferase, partial [Candidatus Heimdallarchaeota archaeon]|nr:GNAT family N-acetyltransferase [Candidatus Heimdallarchaeota archaeon]MCK5144404.1 GNAT family N-acetyltransferase [Candidatus Heimdallarchaeota archaeon]
TMVIPGTKLFQDFQNGDYEPLTNESATNLIARIKELIPPYVRIKRVLRDIPAHQIAAGPNKSDLRLDVQAILEKQGKKCQCIRCREVGHIIYKKGTKIDQSKIDLIERSYEASEGVEHFLSFEETESDALIGFLRLRELSNNIIRPEFDKSTIIVRELHVYGELRGLQALKSGSLQWQHKGYGKELLSRAEEIGKEKDYSKISVISGVGVREYYQKQGYTKDGPYMSKKL